MQTAGKTQRPLPYMPGLDGLRALAVIAVLLYHADLHWIPGGFLGVEVFFVISGFLITSLLLAEWRGRGSVDLSEFWMRRARRLLPALCLVLVATLTYAVAFLPDEVARLRADIIAGLVYVTNWQLIFSNTSYFVAVGRPPLLRHLWSLGVEGQFYLLWPLIFLFLVQRFATRRVLALVLAGAVLSAVLMAVLFDPDADPSRIYFGTDTRAAGLLLGAALAFLWVHGRLSERGDRVPLDLIGFGALGALILLHLRLSEFEPLLYRGGLAIVAVATVALIAVTVHPRARLVPALLGLGVLRWIGLRSYGIYLWHWPVFMVTRPQLDVAVEGTPLLFARLALTAVLAELSFRFIETPVRTGALGRSWQALRESQGIHRQRLSLWWGGAAMVSAVFLLVLGRSLVSAQPSAPPAYLALTGINKTVSAGADSTAPGLVKPPVIDVWPVAASVATVPPKANAPAIPLPAGNAKPTVQSASLAAQRMITPTARLARAILIGPEASVHVVKVGEDLYSIAALYGTTVEAISVANNVAHPNRLTAGQRLTVPRPTPGSGAGVAPMREINTQRMPAALKSAAQSRITPTARPSLPIEDEPPVSMRHVVVPPTPSSSDQIIHVVKPGENLFRISLIYGVAYETISAANNIVDAGQITAGERLVISVRAPETPGEAAPSAASSAEAAPATASAPAPVPETAPAAAAAPADSEPAPAVVAPAEAVPAPAPADRITAIGDSVMLGAVNELAAALGYLNIDAQVSRQASATVSLLQSRRATGQLGQTVIVHVGNNGIFRAEQVDGMMQVLADVRRVVFVNVKIPRRWEGPNNATLAERVPLYPNAVLVDWYAASASRPELFWGDGIHLRPGGAQVYAALIAAAVNAP